MNNKIVEKNFVYSMLSQDNCQNYDKIIPLILADIKKNISDYIVLDGEIKIRVCKNNLGSLLTIEIPAKSVKNCFYF